MAFDPSYRPDDLDWKILIELQEDARLSYRELGERVSLSPPAVADRVRRLEETGVITGYRAIVEPSRVGRELGAYVRVRFPNPETEAFEKALAEREEVLEAHHVTGDDCFFVRVGVGSMDALERTVGFLAQF